MNRRATSVAPAPIGVAPRYSVVTRESVGSTMDAARALLAEGCPAPLILHAGEQTGGRGRHGREWRSPPGNLYVTAALRPAIPVARAPEFSLLAAVTIADTVAGFAGPVQLKWPNDVLLAGGKVAGILLEAVATGRKLDGLLIGMGINVTSRPALSDRETRCLAELAPASTVAGVFAALLDNLAAWEARWLDDGFDAIREAWLARAQPLGTAMTVKLGGHILEGRFAGLEADGALLLADADGAIRRVIAGEIVG